MQSAGLEPVSRRNDRLLSGEFQYHYGTIAKVGRVGLEPTMHRRLSYGQLRYQFRASTQISFFFVLCKKDEPTRLRRDGLEPSTLVHEASKLPLLYPAVGVVGLEPDDLSVKGRLLCQLSYTPVMDHDGVEPPTPRASIWRSTVELTIHKPVTRFGLALLVWKTRILPLDDTSKYSSNTTV